MSSFFASHPDTLSKAIKLNDEDKLDSLLSALTVACIFKDTDEALADFNSAIEAIEAEQKARVKADCIKTIEAKMSGYSIPKSLSNIFDKASEDILDVDIESIDIVFNIRREDDKLVTKVKVIDPTTIKASRTIQKGVKATINGEAITKKMVIANWPNSIAARILKANGCPVGIVLRKNGEPYSDSTRFSAANCVKLDPELKQLID